MRGRHSSFALLHVGKRSRSHSALFFHFLLFFFGKSGETDKCQLNASLLRHDLIGGENRIESDMPKISRIKKEQGGKNPPPRISVADFYGEIRKGGQLRPPPHFGRKFLSAQIFLILEQVEKGAFKTSVIKRGRLNKGIKVSGFLFSRGKTERMW